MDPLTLVMTAITSGALAGLTESASDAIRNGYAKLKELVAGRLGDRPEGDVILRRFEAEPEVWSAPLRSELARAGAERDAALVAAAEELLAALEDTRTRPTFTTTIEGDVHGFVQGNQNTVDMTFGD